MNTNLQKNHRISIHTTLTKLHQKRRYSRPLYSSQTTQSQRTRSTHNQPHTTMHDQPQEPQQKQTTHSCCSRHPTTQRTKQSHNHRQTTHKRADLHPDKQKHPTPVLTRNAQKIKLLRKEVIQPHLPVRLPCYDFVPIADPTFDSSLTSLGHWLRVLPTFMT
jgi:DNA polymerase III alpha subunit